MPDEPQQKSGRFIAILTTAIAALITLVSGVFTTFQNNASQLELETKKHESSLILEAVKTKDSASAAEMLTFLVDSGLIEDQEGKLTSLAETRQVPFVGRGGVPYEAEFVSAIFSKFDSEEDLPPEFKGILVDFADNFVNHRWNRVTTFFEPDYFYGQLKFLLTAQEDQGDIDLIAFFKQYIQEALVEVDGQNYGFNIWDPQGPLRLDDVIRISYLGITESSRGATLIVELELVLSNGTRVIVGYEFSESSIVGGVG